MKYFRHKGQYLAKGDSFSHDCVEKYSSLMWPKMILVLILVTIIAYVEHSQQCSLTNSVHNNQHTSVFRSLASPPCGG